jgi:hypothetical protein
VGIGRTDAAVIVDIELIGILPLAAPELRRLARALVKQDRVWRLLS